jgi:predicted PurR-regulated permease PerM
MTRGRPAATPALTFLLWEVAPFSAPILVALIAGVLFEPLNARLLRAMPAHRNGAEVAMAFSGLAIGAVIAALLMIGWEIFAIRTQRLWRTVHSG